ncbi:hypothetical protein [Bacillus cereus]|jgi:hypothetical protein|uniref:hypothetical protein n=1 Tax=Bacillus cereus group TaxID=86661 RepID=UPI000AD11503|nr:hypothetical protein [Bacillus cereus]MDA2412552.1 hypothetical protein [Bacillus cereus]MDZ4421937.1 hypothetical protein [Bacillus cereus]PFQ59223.1 hypothetical protein COK18_27605 [Bacillus cereus]UDV85370.1 hypothetical protein HQJ03_027660 [Bacillus cereus]UDV90712.1 hypothetical protein HQG80_028615 [Bacillus cereus]
MKMIKKVPVFNYKEFENCLLEMNNRESDVANLMVPIDLAKVLKFIREDSFLVKELLDQNFQPESIVAAVDYMRPKIVGNYTILHKITRNDAVDLIKGNPNEEIIKQQEESGYTGQTVTGLRVKGETILAPVAELYPDVLTDEGTIAPSDISCDQVIVSQPQRSITNQYSALAVNNMLNFIVNQYLILNHHMVFHAKTGYSRAFPVTEEQRKLFNLTNKGIKYNYLKYVI